MRDAARGRQGPAVHERAEHALAHDVLHDALGRAQDARVRARARVPVDHLRVG